MLEHNPLTLGTDALQTSRGVEPTMRFSMREGLSAVFRRKGWLLFAFISPPMIAVALIFLMPPTYRAQATLMVKTGREYLAEGTLDSMQPGPTITKLEEINSEIEILQDRLVIEDTINRVGIEKLYPRLLEPSLLDYLPSRGSVMDRAVKKFLDNLSVKLVKMSNVLDVTFDYDDNQEMASNVLNAYLAAYRKRHAEVFTSGRAASFQTSIDHDTADLQRLEQQQADIKMGNRIYDITAQRSALITQRVDAETHLQETTDRKATLEQRIAYLSSISGQIPVTLTSTETAPNEEVVQANEALTTLRQTESALLGRYSPNNPDVRRTQDQVAALQRRIGQLKSSSVKVSVAPGQLPQQVDQELVMDHAELAPLAAEVMRYQSLAGKLNDELQRLEKSDTALRIVQSRIDALLDNLKSIRAQFDIIRTQDEMDQQRLSSVVPVGPALTPLKPASPMPLLFVALGMLLGMLASGGYAVWAMITNSVFFTAEAVSGQIGLPVLATVPMLTRPKGKVALPGR